MLSGERQQNIRVNDDIEEGPVPEGTRRVQEDNTDYVYLGGDRRMKKRVAFQIIIAVIAALIIIGLATAFFTTIHW
ncbi:unnamed protein product [Bursaphelenchus xylophilus]|nr:unnamed protein product [Bursaphelenchus xylophilus]CAG9131339.1 unnamed protein product [Bursaphelenchus xylophilus]